jgi:hypothetical protein
VNVAAQINLYKAAFGRGIEPDMEDFRAERESLDALTVGRASIIVIQSKINAQISFHAIDTSGVYRRLRPLEDLILTYVD